MLNVKINGTLLAYAEYGKGEPLVFVHGSASDYRTWHNQQEEFAQRYRILIYSRRYHWPNEQIAEDADYSMLEHLDDLETLIQQLGAIPAHLVGHSYGAFLSLLLAIKKPALVRTLVLAEPPVITLFVSNTPKPLELLKLLVSRPWTAITLVKFGAKAMAPAKAIAERGDAKKAMRLFGATILGQQFYDRLSERRLEQVDANATRAEFLGSGFVPLDAGHLRTVRTPTLLITAQHSHGLFHRLADRLEDLLPNVERVEIEGASHIMHEDNALAFNRTVELFLKKSHKAV
jgi:pimeloyl-ACP methyl ester carboxylesterase